MADEREQTIKLLREKALQDTEKLATSQRFGLFSSPVPLGLGDDSYDAKKRPPRNEQGKPITSPPNMKVKASQEGKVKSSYFSVLGYTTIADPYIDPERRLRLQELEEKKKHANEDKKNFIPASGYKTQVTGAYNHEADFNQPKGPKNHKDKDGRVVVGPRNCVTNPAAKSLQTYPKHIKDEFDRYHQFERERIFNEQKLLKEKAPFKSTVFTTENFSKDKEAFGVPNMPAQTKKKEIDLKILKHEAPFKPSHPTKTGEEGYLGDYPPYKGDPLIPTKRRDLVKGKDPFKPQNLGNPSRPTPSVSCFPHNLKRELNARIF